MRLEAREFRELTAFEETLRALAATANEVSVILDISGEVPLGDSVSVLDACRATGFRSISFAAEAARTKKSVP